MPQRSAFEEGYLYDAPWNRSFRPRDSRREVFEVRIERRFERYAILLRMRSRVYAVELGYQLAAGYNVNPQRIVERAESVIGSTLRAWYEARIDPAIGREMAQALVPHWQRLIQYEMERVEYEVRHYRATPHYWGDEVLRGFNNPVWGMPPREDPKAKEKARQLLMRNLDDGQLKSFKKEGWFYVTGADGARYKVKTARSFNVEAADGTAYCGQLTDTPVEDQMLAQKLLLESNPQEFIKKSNVRPPQQAGFQALAIDPGAYALLFGGTTA